MAEKRRPELTEEDLEQTDGEPLPDREAMSVIRGPVDFPLPDEAYPTPDLRGPGPNPLVEEPPGKT
jgi:hypothetical protein